MPRVHLRQVDHWGVDFDTEFLDGLLKFVKDWTGISPRLFTGKSCWEFTLDECRAMLREVVNFFVDAFVARFDRLPVAPCTVPVMLQTDA